MELNFDVDEEAFGREVRAFIATNLPSDIRNKLERGVPASKEDHVTWQRLLNRHGWATPNWPTEYGGPGWTPVQKLIFEREVSAAPAPLPLHFNVTMLGPVLIAFGSPAQKKFFLPKLANLDLWFCQGFSEPGAGSDLASLRTSARREGDDYVINGQKIWTTSAHWADWIFCLVRTDATAAKQSGISFILIDLQTPGITIRPIYSIDGRRHLNEVFFDEVRVPAINLVGEENKGWTYAKFLLTNERTGIAGVAKSRERLDYAKKLASTIRDGNLALINDFGLRERITVLEVQLRALEITELRAVDSQRTGNAGGVDAFTSMLKIRGTEIYQAICELLMSIAGPDALEFKTIDSAEVSADQMATYDALSPLSLAYFYSRASSIYGGTNEVQKNIIAKTLLGF